MVFESNRPFEIDSSLYRPDSEAFLLSKMEDPKNPDLNTISPDTLADLIITQHTNFIIIDCRFDYEYNGGHILNAININSPSTMQEFFFSEKENISKLMNTTIIFHCEFS